MRRMLSYVVTAAVAAGIGLPALNASAASAVSPIAQSVPASMIVSANGLEWVWASPCAEGGCSSGLLVGKDGFGYATAAQWALKPPVSAFRNPDKCASAWFDSQRSNCDWDDPGFLSNGVAGYGSAAQGGRPAGLDGTATMHPSGDTWLVRGAAQSAQTITFGALTGATFGDATRTLEATATSGLPVSYSVPGGAPCTVAGSTLTITGAGSCAVTAAQAGNASYSAATAVTQTLTIAKATQTIPAPAVGPLAFLHAPVTLPATSSAALPVTYIVTSGPCTVSGSTLTLTGGGLCQLSASQAGNSNYLPVSSTPQLTINPALTALTVTPVSTSDLLSQAILSGTARLSARLLPAAAGLPLVFADRGQAVCTGITDNTGLASCAIPTTQLLTAADPNAVFTASFAGTINYAPTHSPASASSFLPVPSGTVVVTDPVTPIIVKLPIQPAPPAAAPALPVTGINLQNIQNSLDAFIASLTNPHL
ncbi:MAG: hypothetical protein JWO22_4243 [Frankiales bacterium]|nr:hypothetical protein [Frankiales bacterium]